MYYRLMKIWRWVFPKCRVCGDKMPMFDAGPRKSGFGSVVKVKYWLKGKQIDATYVQHGPYASYGLYHCDACYEPAAVDRAAELGYDVVTGGVEFSGSEPPA